MIKFFRRIRQNLLAEGKTSKYFQYALGEILLVVIGILIALQINNWNDKRKHNESIKISVRSLKNDLQKDSIQLTIAIQNLQYDLDNLTDFKTRLSRPNATIDTLKHIARYEYLPFFDPSNELNRNTIISLLSTGNIEYLNESIKAEILNHNSTQLKFLKVMDQNISIFLGSQYAQGILMQSENPLMESAVIRGPLMEKYWANKNDAQFLDAMLSTLSGKMIMYKFLIQTKELLIERTNQMIGELNEWEIENK